MLGGIGCYRYLGNFILEILLNFFLRFELVFGRLIFFKILEYLFLLNLLIIWWFVFKYLVFLIVVFLVLVLNIFFDIDV